MTNFKKYIYHKRKELSIICHRGLWVKEKYPENSISAIQNAVDSNFPIVEIDVRKNMNNDFFLMHDEDLIRTTNISGKISSISSNEIKNAFLKKGNGEKNILSNEKIPSLEEVLNTFRKDILFDIDVKNESDRESLISFIHKNNYQDFVDVKKPLKNISEAKEYMDKEFQSKIIKMIVLNITNQSMDEISQIINLTNPEIVEINFSDVSVLREVLIICQKRDIAVWVNTLDDVPNGGFTDSFALKSPNKCWGSLISQGVSMIQSDHPSILKHWYESVFLAN